MSSSFLLVRRPFFQVSPVTFRLLGSFRGFWVIFFVLLLRLVKLPAPVE